MPVNIHSWQWIWLSNPAFAKAGIPVPSNWNEFVAAAPKLRDAGIAPLAVGSQAWQSTGMITEVLAVAIAGPDAWSKVNVDKDAGVAGGPAYAKVFEAAANARSLAADISVTDWNLATASVITGQAAGQIMGDWAQGEFAVAEQVAGKDYSCLPGLGVNPVLSLGGDAFYFPKNKDAAVTAAQLELASLMISKEVQVNFNLKKGSLPIRGDRFRKYEFCCAEIATTLLRSRQTQIHPTRCLPSIDPTPSLPLPEIVVPVSYTHLTLPTKA